jgi:hypothetical protein
MEIFVVVAMQQPCVLVQVYHGENQSNMTTHTLSKSQKGDKSVQRLGPAVFFFVLKPNDAMALKVGCIPEEIIQIHPNFSTAKAVNTGMFRLSFPYGIPSAIVQTRAPTLIVYVSVPNMRYPTHQAATKHAAQPETEL